MKRAAIQRLVPYEADYNRLSKYRKIGTWGLWTISACTVILPVLNYFSTNAVAQTIYNVINFLYFLIIIFYCILNIYTETFLYPATARKRRKGFIDNSLGSKFLEKPVEGYYTNDKLSQGPYKMIVNCAENCYFTKSIAKAMIPQIIAKNVLCGLAFLTIAYIGIKDSLVAIPILQILLSTLFFTELVHHINFIEKLEQLFEQFKTFFINKPNEQQLLQEAVLFFLDYETTLAYNKAPLSDAVYERLNEQLSKEWEELKDRYEIYK